MKVARSNLQGLTMELAVGAIVVLLAHYLEAENRLVLLTVFGALVVNYFLFEIRKIFNYYTAAKSSHTGGFSNKLVASFVLSIIGLASLISYLTTYSILEYDHPEGGTATAYIFSTIAILVGVAAIRYYLLKQRSVADYDAHPFVVLWSPYFPVFVFMVIGYSGLETHSVVFYAVLIQLVFVADYVLRQTDYPERFVIWLNKLTADTRG